MFRFITHVVLLAALVAAGVLVLSSIPGWRFDFSNGQTESNLFLIPRATHYDTVMLGPSHGRIFSRSGNHARVEQILNQSVLNLSTGGGRGVYSTRLFLDYFLSRGNTSDTIVYFIDPWVLYSAKWNEENDLFSDEPFRTDFLSFIIERRVSVLTIINYLKTKASLGWVLQHPKPDRQQTGSLATVDAQAVAKRIESLYPDGLDRAAFARYRAQLQELAAAVKGRGIRLIFIIPSTLLGDLPGEEELTGVLEETRNAWYDLSSAITDPRLYFDHDHLNSAGVSEFTWQYLLPLLVQGE